MEHLIKSVNLTEEKDLSLERLDSRMEFLAGLPWAENGATCENYCNIKIG